MRALPICLLALMLSGCSMLSKSPVEPAQSTATPPVKSEPSKPRATRPAPVRIYTDASELVGKPFRDLGEVSGESCQASNQDSPPNIPTARKRLQINAARMKANAVLLHRCEVTSGTPGATVRPFAWVQRLTSRRNERISVRANRRHPFAV